MWQPIDTYPWPKTEWDYDIPSALVFAPNDGIRIARCILSIDYEGGKEYRFEFDRDCYNIEPTHWMPLPEVPK